MKQIDLLSALEIKSGAVISIIGSGGKTSLMFYLAKEAVKQGMRVLVTTSTRIFVPTAQQYDKADFTGNGFPVPMSLAGIYVCGEFAENGKMKGLSAELLKKQYEHFDLVLIEADGAKEKPIKAWANHEPVIYDFTTHTIGVISADVLDEPLNEELIHRFELFQKNFCDAGDTYLAEKHFRRIIEQDNGILNKAVGKKFIFFNKVETTHCLEKVGNLKSKVAVKSIVGSLKEGRFYV